MNPILPQDLLDRSFSASNGERAWMKADTMIATELIAASGYAVLGGEVWLICDNGNWKGMIPQRSGGPDGVWCWTAEPNNKKDEENWQDFCERCRAYTLSILKGIDVEESAEPSCRDRIRYNLTYVSQEEHQSLPAQMVRRRVNV